MVETYRSVHACAEALGIPYLIVGASARDLVMHHAFGAAIKRATSDIDFAIQVADWDAVEALRQTLAQTVLKQQLSITGSDQTAAFP